MDFKWDNVVLIYSSLHGSTMLRIFCLLCHVELRCAWFYCYYTYVYVHGNIIRPRREPAKWTTLLQERTSTWLYSMCSTYPHASYTIFLPRYLFLCLLIPFNQQANDVLLQSVSQLLSENLVILHIRKMVLKISTKVGQSYY